MDYGAKLGARRFQFSSWPHLPTSGLTCAAGSLPPSWFVHTAHYSCVDRNDPPLSSVLSGFRKILGNQRQKCFPLFSEKPPHFISDVMVFIFT